MHDDTFSIPQTREPFEGDMAFGVRPEHIELSDAAPFRAKVLATEYLGTTQIVTLNTACGEAKARISSQQPAKTGETVGLEFNADTITLFDRQSGRALRSELNEGILHG
jgi:multiple sugar transport system ATP-binding protein